MTKYKSQNIEKATENVEFIRTPPDNIRRGRVLPVGFM
jgi:hypothetical protein